MSAKLLVISNNFGGEMREGRNCVAVWLYLAALFHLCCWIPATKAAVGKNDILLKQNLT